MRVAPSRTGLSPRVRGNRSRVNNRTGHRSIPACAGEPSCLGVGMGPVWVYPRVCGGTAISIHSQTLRPVYPRVCGGTLDTVKRPFSSFGLSPRVRGNQSDPVLYCCTQGLSPRVRGNPSQIVSRGSLQGSIPACAGEPVRRQTLRTMLTEVYPRVCGGTDQVHAGASSPKVYPRVCGGTSVLFAFLCQENGLSPRVRGNRTAMASVRIIRDQVYPRVCGGTAATLQEQNTMEGLSPRVRGNPSNRNRRDDGRYTGLSPRVRGNRASRCCHAAYLEVYPRVCGGTSRSVCEDVHTVGLSPRVRGNPCSASSCCSYGVRNPLGAQGRCSSRVYPRVCGGTASNVSKEIPGALRGLSIPACAGEPIMDITMSVHEPVYPRVCGGTCVSQRMAWLLKRSIPACAGEPARAVTVSRPSRVYPRVCGGTLPRKLLYSPLQGLSPRVRGNLGALPARRQSPTVYPRVCGGTLHPGEGYLTSW